MKLRDHHRAARPPFKDLVFEVERLGAIMRPIQEQAHEAWGVLNPGGVRGPDGCMHLFPRLVAEGNFSRIGHARVIYDGDKPVSVERLGIALEPREPYEVSSGGGGVEDPRVVYISAIERYVMTYTAFVPYEPKIAVAVSKDLQTWERLGVLRYENDDGKLVGNKDATFLAEPVFDPQGIVSLAILHRPTLRLRFHVGGSEMVMPLRGKNKRESICMSYVALDAVLADLANLTKVRRHELVMGPAQPWEDVKIGSGAPPVRLDWGWLLTYHGVAALNGHARYCMGVAILDLERPSRVLYRSPLPILEPETEYETQGLVSNVVFPSAIDQRPEGDLDVYYGAADHVIAAARLRLPNELRPASTSNAFCGNELKAKPVA